MSTRNATITVTPVRHEGRVIAHSAEVSINGRVVYGTGFYGDGTARGMAGAMRPIKMICGRKRNVAKRLKSVPPKKLSNSTSTVYASKYLR